MCVVWTHPRYQHRFGSEIRLLLFYLRSPALRNKPSRMALRNRPAAAAVAATADPADESVRDGPMARGEAAKGMQRRGGDHDDSDDIRCTIFKYGRYEDDADAVRGTVFNGRSVFKHGSSVLPTGAAGDTADGTRRRHHNWASASSRRAPEQPAQRFIPVPSPGPLMQVSPTEQPERWMADSPYSGSEDDDSEEAMEIEDPGEGL